MEVETQAEDLQMLDTDYHKYLKAGFDVATNLERYYMESDVEGKHRFLSCVFPHKLIYLGEGITQHRHPIA